MNPSRARSFLVSLLPAFLLALGCGSGPAECPDGFTPVRGRCVATPFTDGGAPLDADLPQDDAAPDDVGDDAGCATELTFFVDTDRDGVGTGSPLRGCTIPAGHTDVPGDCDDASASRHPGAPEVCDVADDDCDGRVDEGVLTVFYVDADGDGFGDAARTHEACAVTAGYAANDDDCDDASALSHPGATEACDGEDDDCDARVDEGVTIAFYRDCDGDDFAGASALPTHACTEPPSTSTCTGGWTTRAPVSRATTDCRVLDARAFPGQTLFFDTPTMTRPPEEPFAGGYDYDCDGHAIQRYTAIAPGICTPGPGGLCGQAGWTDDRTPECGQSATLVTCGVSDCVRRSSVRAQPCH